MITPPRRRLHELAAPRITQGTHITGCWLAINPHPDAIQMLRARITAFINAGDITLAMSLLSNMADNENEEVSDIFENHLEFLDWQNIRSCTRHPWMVDFLARHADRIAGWVPYVEPEPYRQFNINGTGFNWAMVVQSQTDAAMQLVETHFDAAMTPNITHPHTQQQMWNLLCRNRHPRAMQIVEQHLDQMDAGSWASLATNPSATDLIEEHLLHFPDDTSIWNNIWSNPDIFPPEHEHPVLK